LEKEKENVNVDNGIDHLLLVFYNKRTDELIFFGSIIKILLVLVPKCLLFIYLLLHFYVYNFLLESYTCGANIHEIDEFIEINVTLSQNLIHYFFMLVCSIQNKKVERKL